MHANSLFKNGRHFGFIQVLSIRLTLIWASQNLARSNVFSTFKANGKRQSFIQYIPVFLYYTGCKLIREDYINYIARENMPADYNSFLSASNKKLPHIKYRKLCDFFFSRVRLSLFS